MASQYSPRDRSREGRSPISSLGSTSQSPISPSDTIRSTSSAGSSSTHRSSSHNAPAISPQANLPALPNDLLDFLAREPPPSNNSQMKAYNPAPTTASSSTSLSSGIIPRNSLSQSRNGSTASSSFEKIPTIPPASPLRINYGNSGTTSEGDGAEPSGSSSRQTPLPNVTTTTTSSGSKRSKWSYAFRSRSSDVNPQQSSRPSSASTSPSRAASSSVPNSRRISPTISRSPSNNRMRSPTSPSPNVEASRWLLDAQEVQQGVLTSGTIPKEDEEEREGERETTDDDFNDAEEDLDGDEGEGEDEPTPWRSGRERYTHDLGKGDHDDEEEEEGSEMDKSSLSLLEEEGDDLGGGGVEGVSESLSGLGLAVKRDSLATPLPSDSLFARRRQSNVAAPTLLRDDDILGPPTPHEPSPSPRGSISMSHRSRSESYVLDSRGSVSGESGGAQGRLVTTPSADQLAKGMLRDDGSFLTPSGPSGAGEETERIPRSPAKISTADFVVAVVGPRHVGKSTVIERGLKRPAGIVKPEVVLRDDRDNRVTVTMAQLVLGGQPRSIEVQEIDSDILAYDSKGVIWPEGLAQCEGAMVCYDATDAHALKPLSNLLNAFWTRGSDVPLIVLACKSHPTQSENATDPVEAAETCNVYGAGIVSLDGGLEDRKAKDSFNWMVRAIMDNRGEVRRPSSSATSHEDHYNEEYSNRLPTSRAPPVSVTSASMNGSAETTPSASAPVSFENPFRGPVTTSSRPPSLGLSVVEEAPVATREEESPPSPKQLTAGPTSPTRAVPEAVKLDMNRHSKSSALDLHFSREDMVDKFLFASVTGNDDSYVLLFLIVYRRFARPYDVLGKLIERFDFVAGRLKTDPLLSRFAQMKLCGVLADWIQVYPGDFTAPATFSTLKRFLEGLLPRGATWVANYAIELIPLLRPIQNMIDPEVSWALPDESAVHPPHKTYMASQARRPSVAPSIDSGVSSMGGSAHYDTDANQSKLSVPGSGTSQSTPSRPRSDSDGGGTTGTSDSNDRFGSSGRKIKPSVGSSSTLLDLSNALMELPEDAIAAQITRIAWEAFSQMTPRDLMRHVLAPRDPKNPRALLRDANSNVVRSIDFLNYLADWVATMILVQGKIKWRARIVEKFIHVATSLREQENFDSLMGVLAGLNSQPVFRLTETMELVNLKLEGDRSKIPKRLRSLNKLMATTKSFSAYRLALANSGRTMLPYLGVHLQDITVVNEVKSDMREGQVNWSKFSQMGKSASIVMDCGRNPPVFPVDRSVERCVLGVPLLDKDRQYTLSYQYQARNVDSSSRTKLRKLVQNLSSTS